MNSCRYELWNMYRLASIDTTKTINASSSPEFLLVGFFTSGLEVYFCYGHAVK